MANTSPRPDAAACEMPMGDVLSALREELGDLAQSARQVEGLLAELVARVEPEVVGSVVTDAQLIDAMSQRLEALEIYLRALRGLVPHDWQLDPRPASALLTLSQLARRLTRERHDEKDFASESGDCEMF